MLLVVLAVYDVCGCVLLLSCLLRISAAREGEIKEERGGGSLSLFPLVSVSQGKKGEK